MWDKIKNININQFGLVIAEQVLRSGSNMIIGILLGRVATKDEYGIYTLLFSVMLILLDIQSSLTRMPYVSLRITKNANEKMIFLGNTLAFHLIISLFFMVVSIFSALFLYYNPIIGINSIVILLFTGATIAIMLREFLRQVLLAALDNKGLLFFGLLVNGSLILLVGGLFFWGRLSLKSIYIAITLTSIVPNLGLLFIMRNKINFDVKLLCKDIFDCFSIGKWLVGRTLLSMLSGPIILNLRLTIVGSYSEVAMYGACMVPALLLSPLLQALDSFMLPRIAQAYRIGKAEVVKLTSQFSFVLLILLVFFNLGVYFFSNQIMKFTFNGKYLPPPFLLLLFTLQMSILLYAAPVAVALIAMKNTKAGFVGEVIAALIAIFVGLPLVDYYGIWGVACSLLMAKLASRMFQIFVYKKNIKL